MTAALGTVANWWTDRVAEFGLGTVLAVQAAACLAVICGTGWALTARDRSRTRRATAQAAQDGIRVAENYANHQAVREAVDTHDQPRKEM